MAFSLPPSWGGEASSERWGQEAELLPCELMVLLYQG